MLIVVHVAEIDKRDDYAVDGFLAGFVLGRCVADGERVLIRRGELLIGIGDFPHGEIEAVESAAVNATDI